MRLTTTTLIGLSLLTAACVADVGGECEGTRCKDDEEKQDEPKTDTSCTDANTEEKTTALTLRTATDFASLPTGCWSLNAKLRLEGSAITSLAQLGKLVDVNELEIVDTSLTSIDTKYAIKVYSSLLVSGNTKLANLNNLIVEKWTGSTQGGAFSVSYTIRNNAALTAIDGLKYITLVDGDLRISDNPKLTAVSFAELTTVGGTIQVSGTAATSIALSNLTSLGRLEIASNPQLTQISGLGATNISGDVVIRANPLLATIGSMSSLSTIGGALTIDDNDSLVDIATLTTAMTRVTGTITVANNAKLTGLGRLSRLTSYGATVSIANNPALSYCRAIEVDHCVASAGAVTITNNLQANDCACWCGQ